MANEQQKPTLNNMATIRLDCMSFSAGECVSISAHIPYNIALNNSGMSVFLWPCHHAKLTDPAGIGMELVMHFRSILDDDFTFEIYDVNKTITLQNYREIGDEFRRRLVLFLTGKRQLFTSMLLEYGVSFD